MHGSGLCFVLYGIETDINFYNRRFVSFALKHNFDRLLWSVILTQTYKEGEAILLRQTSTPAGVPLREFVVCL